MANPPTASDQRFKAYLDAHGYIGERNVDWRQRLGVESPTDPDFLVSRAGEQLAICEVKQWESHPVNRRLARQRVGSFSSKEMYQTAADAVQDAADQLKPFADVGLPLVAVVANTSQRAVPLGVPEIAATLFDVMPAKGAPVDSASWAVGALVDRDASENAFNPHPHLAAVVVVHARSEEQDFVDDAFAARRSSSTRTESAPQALRVVDLARSKGEIPAGEYEWVHVFDVSLAMGFTGTPLPDNIFDGTLDRWYVIEDGASAPRFRSR
jgi:hypothetical protein